ILVEAANRGLIHLKELWIEGETERGSSGRGISCDGHVHVERVARLHLLGSRRDTHAGRRRGGWGRAAPTSCEHPRGAAERAGAGGRARQLGLGPVGRSTAGRLRWGARPS